MSLRKRRNPDGFWTKGPRPNPVSLRWRPTVWEANRDGRRSMNGDIEAGFVTGPSSRTIVSFRIPAGTVTTDSGKKARVLSIDVDEPGRPHQSYEIEGSSRAILQRRALEIATLSKAARRLVLNPNRPNPGKAHDLVDIVSARTGEVLESRLFRYVAEQNAWLFRHDGNKVRIQKHKPAAKASRKPMRRNPSHGLTPHYEPEVFPRAKYYDDVEIPKGFIAQHYGNDAAPLWIHPGKRLSLWVDAKRPRDREVSGKRFVLGVTNADYEPDPEPILETNSMRELLWTIANHRPGL